MQGELFDANETILSPLCVYQKHCGHRAELGTPEAGDGCINTPVRCLTCNTHGVRSENTALVKVVNAPSKDFCRKSETTR